MRLERTTHSLEGCCSIQLSYGTVVFSFCGGKYRSSFDFVPPRERPLAGQPHQNDAFPSLLFITKREFCVRIKPAESFDSQNVFGNACNGVANAKKFFAGLATVLQTPESFSWDLQRCCKRQKVFRETCNGVANAKKFFVRLATVLQTPKSFSWDLQHCCKRQKVFRETCNSVASISKSTMTVAARYQRPSLWIRSPIPSSNSRYGKEDHTWGWNLHRSAKSLKTGAALIRLPWRPLGL